MTSDIEDIVNEIAELDVPEGCNQDEDVATTNDAVVMDGFE